MPRIPSTADWPTALAEVLGRLGDATTIRWDRPPRETIEVRHFAGTARHAAQMSAPVRVAHLTDLHVGRMTPMPIQRAAVSLTNEAAPDLVVITGDFVCHSHAYLDALEEIISAFDAPVIGVLGNHDHWSGADEVRRALRRGGMEVLDNAHTTVSIGDQILQMVGLDDAYTGHADREKALGGLRADLPTLGLSHIAEEADGLWAAGVPLVLSGHTHAGQVTLARLGELAIGKLVGHRYVHGLYGCRMGQRAAGAVYVGAGIGAAVMPLRVGERARREIAIFELGVAPGTIDEHHTEQAAHPGRAPTEATRARRAKAVGTKARRRALKKRLLRQ